MTHSQRKRATKARQAKTGQGYQSAREDELRARRKAWLARQPKAPAHAAASTELPALPTGNDFVSRVWRVIALARAEALESRERGERFGDIAADTEDVYRNGMQPLYKALLEEIERFDDADTRKLISLMYAGRERVSFRTMHRDLRLDPPEHARSQVFSKRGDALPTYLTRAVLDAERTGVDLNEPLPNRDLLDALSTAGASDDSLDRWDPKFLALHRIAGGTSAKPEIASRAAGENQAAGRFSLDLGHEAKAIPREAGERLEAFLVANQVPYSRTSLSRTYIPRERATGGSTIFSREDVHRCGALAPDESDWAVSKAYREEAHISYDRVNTRGTDPLTVVAPQYVTAIGVRHDDKPAWKFSGRIDAEWGDLEPLSRVELAQRLEEELDADRVVVRALSGNVAHIDAIWFAKDSGFNREAAEALFDL